MKGKFGLFALPAFLALAPFGLQAAATITIQNNDAANVGFNDPTVVLPVGGNSGTTLGQQRLIAFQAAGNKWGATLTTPITILIKSQWTALTCTATAAVLGSAGATEVFSDFAGAIVPNRWYGFALANKLAGIDLDPGAAQINANFNVNLGNAGCLTGIHFYLGLDGNHGSDVDLVTVLTHEFGHGLGFSTFTNGSTGAQLGGTQARPAIWDDFLLDNTTNKNWATMTAPERVASAINNAHLVWTGANVTSAVPSVLAVGAPALTVSAPLNIAGSYAVGTAAFGPALNSPGVSGEVMPIVDTPGNIGLACVPPALSALNAAAVNGKIAMVDRGVCGFIVKVKAVQDAGAIGVIVVDNVAGSPPAGLGGTDPTITIPSVRITLSDGAILKAVLAKRSRTHSGLIVNIGVNLALRAGADALNRPYMFAPNPFQAGSSVSHWDITAFPNQLMEPSINADLTHEVTVPNDLTFQLFKDLGWN